MADRPQTRIILAIESAIRGGSLCLFDGRTVLGSRYGNGEVSRAEDLLSNIADLIESVNVAKPEIDKIAVSIGPGSYTGIRIGVATALGLSRALACECVGIGSLEAMAYASRRQGQIIAAVPFGKNDVAWQEFLADAVNATAGGHPVVETFEEFKKRISDRPDTPVVLQREIHAELKDVHPPIILVDNLAEAIGIASQNDLGSADLTPIYIRNPAASGRF